MRVFLAVLALAGACSPRSAPSTAPPAATQAPAQKTDSVTIGVGPNGTYTINGQPTHAKSLEEALQEVARRDAEVNKIAGGAK